MTTYFHRPRYAIWDLDNCLFDDGWRIPYIDWTQTGNARYEVYNQSLQGDKTAHFQEWKLMSLLAQPIFISGRPEKFRAQTLQMIEVHLPVLRQRPDDEPVWERLTRKDGGITLYMRETDDRDRPADLKAKLLDRFMKEHDVYPWQIIAAFDDVQSIVDMYRSRGIPATVLRVHDPELAYERKDL
jgi:hypothetical protein